MIDSILIVEDDTDLRLLFAFAFEDAFKEAEVTACYTKDQAVKLARQRKSHFSLYVLDGNFPENEGEPEAYGACFIFYDKLVAMYESRPNVIIYTGTDEIKEEAERRGIPAFIKGNGIEPIEELARRYVSN